MGSVKSKTMFSIYGLVKHFKGNINLQSWDGSLVHKARTNIVKKVLDSDCTHLLFIDHDMIFRPEVVDKLLAEDKDIIGADYNMRKFPLTTTVKCHDEDGKLLFERQNKVYECVAVGTGFMLIKTSIFSKIPKPWFFFKHDEDGETVIGEDMWFCNQARKAGFKVFADPTINVGHIGDYIY